ncbi:MAG: phosphonate ABC transporter, permease protein PhnE [Bacillota bacterium]
MFQKRIQQIKAIKLDIPWVWIFIVFTGIVLVAGSFAYTINVSWEKFTSDKMFENLFTMLGEMLPPNLLVVSTLGKPIIETLAMSVMATLIAVAISFPLSFLAAKNTTPNPAIRPVVKGLFSALRAVPELIMGVIFVAAVGFGILPGILALGFHSAGMLGKFYAEAIEKVDVGLSEAIESVGGSRFHTIVFGVIPQIISHSVDYSLYRWEYNFRASTVVGLIGAGGIGFQLIASLRIMQYRDVLAILLVVFVLVQLVDGFGNIIRKRIIEGADNNK